MRARSYPVGGNEGASGTDSPVYVRAQARLGELKGPTCGMAAGFVQANLVIVPGSAASAFRRFCELNPKPCPLLEVTPPGEVEPVRFGPGADLRTDVPRYRVFRDGILVEEVIDIASLWRHDLVSFLLGCSFSFEEAMLACGLPVRHLEEGRNVPMYRTDVQCRRAGDFEGPMVVSMRPLPEDATERVRVLCSRFPFAHGSPVHAGDPRAIGIDDLAKPDFGDAVTVRPGEVPVFWGCGVTPQEALRNARLELAITHSPGCMFVSDITSDSLIDR